MSIAHKYSDIELIRALNAGSEDTFRYVYDTYYCRLNTFAYHIVMCEESHDIVHDVFAKMWNNRKNLTIDTNLSSYLYTAVRNRAFNVLRDHRISDSNNKKLIETILWTDDNYEDPTDELLHKIEEYIEMLPEQQRKIIKLRFEGDSYQDIAEKLGISVRTINNHIGKIYNFIRIKYLLICVLSLELIKNSIFR